VSAFRTMLAATRPLARARQTRLGWSRSTSLRISWSISAAPRGDGSTLVLTFQPCASRSPPTSDTYAQAFARSCDRSGKAGQVFQAYGSCGTIRRMRISPALGSRSCATAAASRDGTEPSTANSTLPTIAFALLARKR
jgi:hypothetical protein